MFSRGTKFIVVIPDEWTTILDKNDFDTDISGFYNGVFLNIKPLLTNTTNVVVIVEESTDSQNWTETYRSSNLPLGSLITNSSCF